MASENVLEEVELYLKRCSEEEVVDEVLMSNLLQLAVAPGLDG